MQSPIDIHIPAAYSGNMVTSDDWPTGWDYKIPFATPRYIQCDLGSFLNQSVNGGDYWMELRSFAIKMDGHINLAVKRPCISVAILMKGDINGELSGHIFFELAAKTCTLFYLPAGIQRINMTRGEYMWICIFPPSYYLKNIALEQPAIKAIVRRSIAKENEGSFLTMYHMPATLLRIVKRLEKTNKTGAALDFDLRMYMLEILSWYNEQFKKNETPVADRASPKKTALAVKEYIHANLGDQHLGGLNELSIRFHTGSKPLTTAFKKLTGKTIPRYINDERMEWAKRLLDKKEMRVFEIAWVIGYSDTANFNRSFKNKFGYPPLNRKAKDK